MISIVIPTLDEATTIAAAIGPFLAQATEEVEVIVADGGSTDGTRDVVTTLSTRDPRVRLVDNPARIIPEALNVAIRASRGEVIVRMDGHSVPASDYLAACVAALADSHAWNVGGQMVKVGETRAGRAASAAASSPFGIGGGARHHLLHDASDITSVWLGCWPRWVFERVGLFDPEMVVNEDEELNRRIIEAGGTVRFDPSISATYRSRGSWSGLVRQYHRYGMYKVRSIQKHPSLLRVRHLIPAALIAAIIGSLVYAAVTPAGAIVTVGLILAWVVIGMYFARSVAAAYRASVIDVLVAYACLHIGYGVGFWVGLVRFAPRWVIDRRGTHPSLDPIGSDRAVTSG